MFWKEGDVMNEIKTMRTTWILFGVLFLFSLGEGLYTLRLSKQFTEIGDRLESTVSMQGETIQKLTRGLSEADDRFTGLQNDIGSTQKRLGTAQAELQRTRQLSSQLARQHKETKEAAEQLSSQLGQLQQEQVATKGTVGNLSSDVSGVKQEVGLTKEELATTRSDLQRMVGDLGVQSGLIARNHDELAELRLRGERDYYEFDLRKIKQPQRFGTVALALQKTDVKRQKYTLRLVADDRTIEKKDKTVNEPVQFYQDGSRQPTEIVVNQIYKDRIVGYVSVAKQKEVRSAAAAFGSR